MDKGIKYDGYLSEKELAGAPGVPSIDQLNVKPLAVIECIEPIPCNPCERACPFSAITIGDSIWNLPVLDANKCKGCGACIPSCPGLAIFVVDMNYSSTSALVKIPYEYFPLPKEGMEVDCLNRKGEAVTKGRIHSVKTTATFDKTYIIGIEVNKKFAMEVRNIRM
ncbi:MAG: hypothetical protein PWP27_803 [Clostridiales bacterium]|jgi:Fe-S-cluster-containing hydrogenase component 2|nr:hypothetical protein [Clostridiales bacterium]MDK2932993.1 hypothetical protein [Clostridiales bacterium]